MRVQNELIVFAYGVKNNHIALGDMENYGHDPYFEVDVDLLAEMDEDRYLSTQDIYDDYVSHWIDLFPD